MKDMTKLDVGQISVTLSGGSWDAQLGAAAELEDLGYSTIWVAGGQIKSLDRIADVIRATRQVPVATGIIPVGGYPSEAVAKAYAEIEEAHPGRFIAGLGGAHGPKPLQEIGDYLDRLDTVPQARRVLSALGPRMLELARDRTAGALPLLVTPGYVARARELLGEDSSLVIMQYVVLESDPAKARQIARGPLGFLSGVGGYAAHFRRMGFADEEIADLGDRLVDALVSWGDLDKIASEVSTILAAGADQVAVTVLSPGDPDAVPIAEWRQLAKTLIA